MKNPTAGKDKALDRLKPILRRRFRVFWRSIIATTPELHCSARSEPRQRGLCPICGARIRLTGDTSDGRFIGACGDAFTRKQWRSLSPRTFKTHALTQPT